MSRGMPSMTALLGMVALAGYQNRDKLMEMFNNATGSSSRPEGGGQPGAQGDMMGSLSKMLGGAGVGGLLGGGLGEIRPNSILIRQPTGQREIRSLAFVPGHARRAATQPLRRRAV